MLYVWSVPLPSEGGFLLSHYLHFVTLEKYLFWLPRLQHQLPFMGTNIQVNASRERETGENVVYHKYWRYECDGGVDGRSELGYFHCLCPAQGVQ